MSAKPQHVYIISALRKIWRWSKERRDAIKAATKGKFVTCASCKELVPTLSPRGQRKLYTVDHIQPVVPPTKLSPTVPRGPNQISWDKYIENMMFGKLQILCHPCHKLKTRTENNERKKHKLERK